MGFRYRYPPNRYYCPPYNCCRPGFGGGGVGFALALIILLFVLFCIIGGGRRWY